LHNTHHVFLLPYKYIYELSRFYFEFWAWKRVFTYPRSRFHHRKYIFILFLCLSNGLSNRPDLTLFFFSLRIFPMYFTMDQNFSLISLPYKQILQRYFSLFSAKSKWISQPKRWLSVFSLP